MSTERIRLTLPSEVIRLLNKTRADGETISEYASKVLVKHFRDWGLMYGTAKEQTKAV
ncbi:hypothetical protein ACFSJY_03750 [Thalassotalea euphylliae]|uniref:hypothetical protein n=1 Tax=Thalassotalea euphylliae TaxID=1655234 RepID=UPI0036322BD6